MTRLLCSISLLLVFLITGTFGIAQSSTSLGADAPTELQQTPPSEIPDAVDEVTAPNSFFDRTFSKRSNGNAPSKAGIFVRKAGKTLTGIALGNPVKKLMPRENLAKAKDSKHSIYTLLWLILLIILIALLLNLIVDLAAGPVYGSALALIILIILILWLMGEL